MADLKPCPFCGYRYASVDRDSDGFAYVQCHKSGCMARTDGCLNEQEAIRLWNTRKPMEAAVDELEKRANDNDRCADRLSGIESKKKIASWRARAQAFRDAISIVRGKE